VNSPQHRLAVLGAGAIGTGVATLAVEHGVPVVLVDTDAGALARAESLILARTAGDGSRGTAGAAGLRVTRDLAQTAGSTVVVEAVTEQAVVKAKVLMAVCGVVEPGTPLASCSSGIPVDELADWAGRPRDVLGVHFTEPAHLVPAVEVTRGPRTCDEVVRVVLGLLAALGRRPVPARTAAGPVAVRLLYPMLNSAARIAGEHDGDPEEVDELMRACFGYPEGPLRLADRIGIDSLVDALEAVYARTGDESFRPCGVLLEKVDAGRLGRKSGQGFYSYGEAAGR
jgi:methoxymalonate biosynthesis protein